LRGSLNAATQSLSSTATTPSVRCALRLHGDVPHVITRNTLPVAAFAVAAWRLWRLAEDPPDRA